MENGNIIIYQMPDGQTSIDVVMDHDTVWLTQTQIVDLFESSKANISSHIKNIFITNELDRDATVRNFRTVRKEGKREVARDLEHYNLDLILSVGYRVNSKRGTQFRIWANTILKDFLASGYSLNKKLLKEKTEQLNALKQTMRLLGNVLGSKPLSSDEADGLAKVLADYTYALDVLDKYDHRTLTIEGTQSSQLFIATYGEAIKAIHSLKDKFGGSALFGNEKDESFKSSIATIYQSFGGKDLYPSVEEKASNLLYFVVKNHSFSDGNKRIAAFLFVWFLDKNKALYKADGSKKIADNALVALTLMIAESKPDEKDIMTQVVVNLINSNN